MPNFLKFTIYSFVLISSMLRIIYAPFQSNQICAHFLYSIVLLIYTHKFCSTVLTSKQLANRTANWPIGLQLRVRIAARFGIRIDKAAFNCLNESQPRIASCQLSLRVCVCVCHVCVCVCVCGAVGRQSLSAFPRSIGRQVASLGCHHENS